MKRGFPDETFRSSGSGKKVKGGDKGILGAETTQKEIEKQPKAFSFLGYYLASIPHKKGELFTFTAEKIRGRYTYRTWFQKEFNHIWEKQQHYPAILTNENKKIVYHYLFFQFPQKAPIKGNCSLETWRQRGLKASLIYEEFRTRAFLNNFFRSIKMEPTRIDEKLREKAFSVMEVGCVCAERLIGSTYASSQEKTLRFYQDKKTRFVNSPRWKFSEKGNQYRNTEGFFYRYL